MAASQGHALRIETAVNGARSIAYWSRDGGGDIDYLKPDHHTLSIYIEGGKGVRERQLPALRGAPGAICLLPAGHESRWFNDALVNVLHVYFCDEHIEALTGRQAPALSQIHFGHDPLLHRLGMGLVSDVDWRSDAECLVVEQLVRASLARTIGMRVNSDSARGLSVRDLARTESRIRESVDCPCTLEDLAAGVGLGLRQFTRRYKAATGKTPGRRLIEVRIESAQQMIRAGHSLADVALDCGFASQSHLTRRFHEIVGTTPARWRRQL